MVQAPLRAPVGGPAFVRQLARLTDAYVPPSQTSLPDRLSQWLDWTQAIALSTALDSRPTDGCTGPRAMTSQEDECAQLRASLAEAITGEPAFAPASPDGETAAPPDYAVLRQRYLTLQRRIQAYTGRLRGQLRDRLAEISPEMARLAQVDAVMEQALSPREHGLMSLVPALLGEHFERLGQAEEPASDNAGATTERPATRGAWLDAFRKDMQSMLLAELDVRFQPVEGLLAALRSSQR